MRFPALAPVAETLALALVVVVITYLTMVIGELVPKQLALRRPGESGRQGGRPLAWLAARHRARSSGCWVSPPG